jgi:hypothetical protein
MKFGIAEKVNMIEPLFTGDHRVAVLDKYFPLDYLLEPLPQKFGR